jgi:ABC-type amino acid transport substrate-binding protein
VTGQATDVVNGILARLNQKAGIEILPWSEGYGLARAGPGVALYSTGRTDEREQLFKWVGPVASFDYTLYAKKGAAMTIDSLEAAKKAGKIGVVKDDARHQFLVGNRFGNLTPCTSDAECLRDLVAGKTDLWLGSSTNSAAIAQMEGVDPSAFEAVYLVRTIQLYIAFSNDTPDSVIRNWQDALDAMKKDGSFDAIRKNYGMTAATVSEMPATAGAQADLALLAVMAGTDGQIKNILRPLEVLAVTVEARSGEWQSIKPLLAALEGKEPNARVWYARPDGSYYTVVDDLTSASLKNRSYFPVVLAGNESVGTVVVSLSTGRNAAIAAVPVMNKGAVTGVLGASVYLDVLTDTLRGEVPDPFVFYAVDTEGKFALHSEKGQISRSVATITADSSFGQAMHKIRSQDAGTVEYNDGGIHYAARFRTSPLTGWRFVVAWPQAVK